MAAFHTSRSRITLSTAVVLVLLMGTSPITSAQTPQADVYYPLDQHSLPPGVASQWSAVLRKAGQDSAPYFQPIRVDLPSSGHVTLFDKSPQNAVTIETPAQAGFLVGRTYRLKISHMPEFPGIELYPSIEVLDRLHPPPAQKDAFPVPMTFTREDIERALSGHLITRVVYVEQPQLASPFASNGLLPTRTLSSSVNLLAEADRLGRPMLIVRLGGRLPASNEDTRFFGNGAPISDAKSMAPKQTQPD